MLKENKPKRKGTVISLKLVTAEEVVGRVVSEDGGALVLEKPVSLAHTVNQQTGNMEIQLVPFMSSIESGEPVTIREEHVVASSKPSSVLGAAYIDKVKADLGLVGI